MLMTLVFVQAVAGPFLPAAPRPRSDKPCPVVAGSTDVVVCGRNDDRYRLRTMPQEEERLAIPKAETHIGNTALAAETEQVMLAGGQQSKRLMVRWKVPLGRKKQP